MHIQISPLTMEIFPVISPCTVYTECNESGTEFFNADDYFVKSMLLLIGGSGVITKGCVHTCVSVRACAYGGHQGLALTSW